MDHQSNESFVQHIFILYDFLSENVVRYSFMHFENNSNLFKIKMESKELKLE